MSKQVSNPAQYEFAELSFEKIGAGSMRACTFSRYTVPIGDENYGERSYERPWFEVLGDLGIDGWAIGGIMETRSGILQIIVLQRQI
jgi:hypothetical protein